MLKRMEFKTIALDTREGHLNTDRIYQLGYLLYETDTNMGKFSDGEHHFKDLPYFVGSGDTSNSSFKGLWNSETEYNEGDIVFDENNVYYVVIDKNKGEIPAESSKYIILNDNIVRITNNLSNRGTKLFTFADDTTTSNIYTLASELTPTIDSATGIASFPNGIEGYYNSEEIDDITSQISSEFENIDAKIAEMIMCHSSFRGEYASNCKYNLGNYVHDGNDFYMSLMNENRNKSLSNSDYWKKITNDNLSLIKFQSTNDEAKICLTTIDIKNCECENCEENPKCKCHSGIDSLKLSKDNSPTVNLQSGDMIIKGALYANGGIKGSAFNELLERVRILEEKVAELENKDPFTYDSETQDLNFD